MRILALWILAACGSPPPTASVAPAPPPSWPDRLDELCRTLGDRRRPPALRDVRYAPGTPELSQADPYGLGEPLDQRVWTVVSPTPIRRVGLAGRMDLDFVRWMEVAVPLRDVCASVRGRVEGNKCDLPIVDTAALFREANHYRSVTADTGGTRLECFLKL
jgi:hypothetical protein